MVNQEVRRKRTLYISVEGKFIRDYNSNPDTQGNSIRSC